MSLIVFRVDSSNKIGSGHVMRCLALAEELHQLGKKVEFIVREHQGSVNDQIVKKGFKVYSLFSLPFNGQKNLTKYEKWLGVKQDIDADEVISVLKDRSVDWLIVDHYGIDSTWEKRLRPYTKKIMVIDDLANRHHDCDLLLDQNYIHNDKRYDDLIASKTIKLFGPNYALLRKEFKENINLCTRQMEIKKVFVFFGASDQDNLTMLAINALSQSKLKFLLVDVVIGSSNQYHLEIEKKLEKHPNIKLHNQVDNIAELMLKADLAIGSGGISTWERMALGLPSIVITFAENQIAFIRDLYKDNYINWLGSSYQVTEQIICDALLESINNSKQLQKQSQKCKKLVNAKGAQIVSKFLDD